MQWIWNAISYISWPSVSPSSSLDSSFVLMVHWEAAGAGTWVPATDEGGLC